MIAFVIDVVLLAIGSVAAYLGYELSVKPLKNKEHAKRTRYRAFFVVALVLSVPLGVYRAYQSYKESDKQSAQIEDIHSSTRNLKHTYVQIYNPTPVSNDLYLPFTEGKKPDVGIQMFNPGNFAVKRSVFMPAIRIQPGDVFQYARTQDEAFQTFLKYKATASDGGPLAPHSAEGRYLTVTTDDPLTKDQVAGLEKRTLALCAFADVVWEDDTGQYCTSALRCLSKDSGVGGITYDWRLVSEKYNQEVSCKFEIK